MKKILSLLTVVLILSSALLPLTSCSRYGPAPALETVYDRLVEVIEGAHEANVLLFGAGLPTYERGDAEDALIHRYYGFDDSTREYVTPYAKYAFLEEMEAVIARVYGRDYRESLLESLFTGYADADISINMPARYSKDEKGLYQNRNIRPLVTGVKIYDYAAMEIIEKGSNGRYLYVSVPYSTDGSDTWNTAYLSFVYEDGNWFLDSPSC